MKRAEVVDYIIVGQGLAGSCLALQLILRNKRILVFDQPKNNHASAVAAGLFNPITGRVMAKTWLADILFPHLLSFYSNAERILQQKFLFPRPLYRPFISVQEQNEWMGKSADSSLAEYIKRIFLEPVGAQVYNTFGGLLVKNSGHVDVGLFIESLRLHLKKANAYREEKLDEEKLEIGETEIRYRDVRANKLIFCNGIESTQSRYFSWLPINPLKGETMSIRTASLDYNYNRGVYIVPGRGQNEYTVGATYDFQSQSPEVTGAGRLELETKLKALIGLPYTIIGQNWGIRPTSFDQKLILGAHPQWKSLIIFNGLGTKGVSFAPYFSAQLAAWLEGEAEIMREVNIERFKALYSKFE